MASVGHGPNVLHRQSARNRPILLPRGRSCRRSVRTIFASSALPSQALGMLQKSRPIDRLRYQAKLIFDSFDIDADGKLDLSELQTYIEYSEARLGSQSSPLAEMYASLSALVAARPTGSQQAEFEEFVDLVRAQVAAMEGTKGWIKTQIPPKSLSDMLYKAALTLPEMSSVLCIFKLLDRDGDGYLKLEDLKKAQSIEKKVVEGVLEDADEDEDGLLSFADFLTSYHKERTVFMTMAVMLAHTACFWLIFNSPIDNMLKIVLVGLLLMKPHLITGPVTKVWQIGKAVLGRFTATKEMVSKGASWSSVA